MKRFLLIGTLFCTAALLGLGITLFLPSEAGAWECDETTRITMFKCVSDECTDPNFPVEKLDCGSSNPPGHYCDCYHVSCQLRCPPGW
ncbi:MAG: hypothetical protein OEV49_04120 [candidate division Zixibacteria bacterium]|nr:hypothetical protein [candidate division Zixibacteria bacterium]MDH3936202.1 hypothetical protein [candidate division Zixibacteria bacterium]MDH4033071.1 hypothetical protein [candidate division Zixibacteria bacterium]